MLDEVFEEKAIVLLGAMFAALVAGFFAFTNLVASKDNKISEFRQDWINSLRESISCYISSLTYLLYIFIALLARKKNEILSRWLEISSRYMQR
ncbi:TPA: hypothetical protein RQM98_002566 [Aeromonas salmonicida]|nr:hypothetical protein [Aeromonas salmonicida]